LESLLAAREVIDHGGNYQPRQAFYQEKHKGGDAGPLGPFNGGTFSFCGIFLHTSPKITFISG
jgi:hypothetical protein